MPVAKTKSTKLSGKRKAVKLLKRWYVEDKTYHEGANDERTAILAKVRREIKKAQGIDCCTDPLVYLQKWLLDRDTRYKKNPGGL